MASAGVLIKVIFSLFVFAVAYMIVTDIKSVIMLLSIPMSTSVPSAGVDLVNFLLFCIKWIIVLFVLSIVWGTAIESQRQDGQ